MKILVNRIDVWTVNLRKQSFQFVTQSLLKDFSLRYMYSLWLISIVFYYWQNEHFFLTNEGSFSFGKNSFIQRISITIKYLWAVLFQFPIDFEVICFNWEQSFTSPNLYCKNSAEYVTIVSFQGLHTNSMQCTLYNLQFMDGDHGELAGIACFVLQEKILFWPCNKSFINCPSLFGRDGWMYIGLIFFKWTFTSSQFSVWGILCGFSKCSQCS